MRVSLDDIGSGIDIKALVADLLEAESKQKLAKLNESEHIAVEKITGIGKLRSSMSSYLSKLDQLQTTNEFELLSATASTANNIQVISATANADAVPGNYSVVVTQLALAQKMGSGTFQSVGTVVGTGNLIFTIDNFAYTFTITSANGTVQGIADAINAQTAETGISATLIATNNAVSMVFSSQTGLNNTFTVTVTNDGDGNNTDNAGLSQLASNNLTTLQNAQNAIVNIENVPVVSDSNTIQYAISGVTIDLITTNVGMPVTLSVNYDVPSAQQAVREFVNGYNEVFSIIRDFSTFDKVGKDSGVFLGDATFRSIEFQLRNLITSMYTSDPGGYSSLSQIGILSDPYSGKLRIDEEQLLNALNTNFMAVGQLFMDPVNGLVVNMQNMIESYTEVNGVLQFRTESIKSGIKRIDDQILHMERHLKKMEKRLMAQFIAMDVNVARLRSMSDYLATQLEGLADPMMFRN